MCLIFFTRFNYCMLFYLLLESLYILHFLVSYFNSIFPLEILILLTLVTIMWPQFDKKNVYQQNMVKWVKWYGLDNEGECSLPYKETAWFYSASPGLKDKAHAKFSDWKTKPLRNDDIKIKNLLIMIHEFHVGVRGSTFLCSFLCSFWKHGRFDL